MNGYTATSEFVELLHRKMCEHVFMASTLMHCR